MGVAVAVGAGIFSIGAQAAAFHAGPAVMLSFLIAGVVCGAAVMCYAEFASMIPVAGSAYTFTYTTVGEIVAWVIGWDLILEMLMAGSVVSKYWGVYLNHFFRAGRMEHQHQHHHRLVQFRSGSSHHRRFLHRAAGDAARKSAHASTARSPF